FSIAVFLLRHPATSLLSPPSLPDALPICPGISEGLLTSGSTRQPGYIKSEDLFTTLMDLFSLHEDVPAGATSGAVMTVATGHGEDRKSTRLNSSHVSISYAVFSLKK